MSDLPSRGGSPPPAWWYREGTLRKAAWVAGEFLDEAVFGLLAGLTLSRSRGMGMAGTHR